MILNNIEDLRYKLLSYDSPFSWLLPVIDEAKRDEFLIYKLDECQTIVETNEFNWRSYIIGLLLGYELWNKIGDIVSAKQMIHSCCSQLETLSNSWGSGQMYAPLHGVLEHITLTMRAHLYLENREYILAAKIAESLQPINGMSISQKAGLCGIKATIFSHYKPSGLQEALNLALIARDMDPFQAEWHFLVAYCMGKMRKDNDPVSQLELDEIESACKLQTDATYIVRLAQVYADYSCLLQRKRNDPAVCASPKVGLERSAEYAERAVWRFKEALELNPHCPRLKAKVAYGLLTIEYRTYTDAKLAKTLLDEVVDLLPKNSSVHFSLGKYYDKFERDCTKAIECLTKAHELGNYSAFMALITSYWKYGMMSSCLIEKIEEALERYKAEEVYVAELWVLLGASHLVLEENWTMAVECFVKSLELDTSASVMEGFCGFYWKNKKTNLLEVVTNELRIKVKENYTNKTVFHVFLGKVITINQKLFIKPPVSGLFIKFKVLQMKSQIKVLRAN